MKVIDIGYPQARTLPERTLPDCKVHTWMTFVMDSMFFLISCLLTNLRNYTLY